MYDWQTIVVLAIVTAAALYVGRVTWLSVFSKSGGGCNSCNSCDQQAPATAPKVLVELGDANRKEIG